MIKSHRTPAGAGGESGLPCLVLLLTPRRATPTQSKHAQIVRIILSQQSVKGIMVSINAQFFGQAYYECPLTTKQVTYTGVISSWKPGTKKSVLMVKWEGAARHTAAPLAGLDVDWNDQDLELELLEYADGRPAPTLVEADASDEEEDKEEEVEEEEEAPPPEEYERNGQVWKKRPPTFVGTDNREGQARTKPELNGGGADLKTIDKLFTHLLTSW